MTEPELKLCPFCGYEFVEIFVSCSNIFSVRCQKCKGETGLRDTEKDAQEAWNTRAISVTQYRFNELEAKYKKAVEFIESISKAIIFSTSNHFYMCEEAKKLLRELGE